ncbi:MAG: iron-containing alcohol dehydrogenase [Anaerolineae bacterium]|nr:iron-containing alcohol dehydrogenase [Anaerolineae bacterium]
MWYFVSPKIVFGEDALDALEELEGSRALIVTDQTLVKLGIVEKIQSRLRNNGFDTRVFDEVEPDPSLETVQRGVQIANQYQPDWIVALGGGSPMDAAKSIWVLYEHPEMQAGEITPIVQLKMGSKAHLATIPTTSGTGSEVTWGIVLTNQAEQRKMGLGNRANLADIAIVDPALAAGMPPQLTADTGLDALTHAVEGYTCAWHNDFADGMCLVAARLVMTYLPRAVANGKDMEAREHLHNAAACAGLGFSNALVSVAHAMGHTLGATFHIPHGRAVGLVLPYTIEFCAAEAPERFVDLGKFIGCVNQDGQAGARQLAQAIRGLCQTIGEPLSLHQAGLDEKAFENALEKMIDDAFNDASMVSSSRSPGYDELRQIFRCAYYGTPVDF